ncbi:PQQ-dependent sugar dehydrogenase [Halococcus sp. IIIV-5B]|uniref:PQQ-dependent sugar dehydrogenase n=1 Tax=Halococcus sp. IIIV-5B TaxID=2321230 RepID=UPI000E72C8B5|nr:PQQ-dependent sugar dehydrogenase [Halococcus sp. IIIV-5B]RJT05471.1 hypothetical protein D3261_07290 [Halococcus sp. IIIV-5B]
MTNPEPDHTTSRRRFLLSSAVVTGASALGTGALGTGSAQSDSQPETIRLGGEIAGWQGREPEAIAGTTNPSLELEPGVAYRIVWENLDGMGHNVAVLDEDDAVLTRTEVMSEEGERQSLTFTAREGMARYVCQPHSTSMSGSIRVGSGSDASTTTAGTTSEGDGENALIPTGPAVRTETVVDGGLTAPLAFEVPPERRGRYYVVDRVGQVYLADDDGLREEPFIDVSDQLTEITAEMGLLGLAFHPDFAENRKFYLRYSAPSREGTPEEFDHTEVLAEFTASDDGTSADPDSERTVMEIPSPYDTHNSGAVAFGPEDGYLYMGMGDGGGGYDMGIGHVADWYERFGGTSGPNVTGNGQDVTDNLLGSVLRIDVDAQDGEKAYGIPEDNPLVGQEGLDEHYAWGFRNPWRMGFSNGKLFVGDVGQELYEEVNVVEKGGNYGWNVREGSHCFEPKSQTTPDSCPTSTPDDVRGGEPLIDPIIDYPHTHEGESVGTAVIGGYVYDNDAIPGLTGDYVFGDYLTTKGEEGTTGRLFAGIRSDDEWSIEEIRVENSDTGRIGASVLGFGRDNRGRLYVLTTAQPGEGDTGSVYRLRPPENAQAARSTAATARTANATGSSTTGIGRRTTDGTTATAGSTGSTTATASGSATEATPDTGGSTNGSSASGSNETTGSTGPGFGVVAALVGLGGLAVRALKTE